VALENNDVDLLHRVIISSSRLAPRETVSCFRLLRPSYLELKGKQNPLFHAEPDIKCFVMPPNSENRKKIEKNSFLDVSWDTNLPWFQGARPDHVRVENSSCCFSRKLLSFVRPRQLANFDHRHVLLLHPIGKHICIGTYKDIF